MAPPKYAVTTDGELVEAVRAKTSYEDSPDELPGAANTGQLEHIIQDAKRYLYAKTGSDKWYTDTAYGQSLVALLALKMKEAVENINIERYGIGDETLSFSNADPEDSQQVVSWSSEMNEMLDKSGVQFPNKQDLNMRNTASYIG